VTGYVENDHSDDSVHIEAEGEETDLDRFTLLCGEGTPYSLITNMKIEAVEPTGKYDGFLEIR
jgi:acylphosphatase